MPQTMSPSEFAARVLTAAHDYLSLEEGEPAPEQVDLLHDQVDGYDNDELEKMIELLEGTAEMLKHSLTCRTDADEKST